MSKLDMFSSNTQSLIKSISGEVTENDIDTFIKARQADDESYRIRTIVNAWEKQHTAEREIRKTYAYWLLVALFIQVVVANTAFFLLGLGIIVVEQWVANVFIVTVFGEIAGMSLLIVKYLFPKVGTDVLKYIDKGK